MLMMIGVFPQNPLIAMAAMFLGGFFSSFCFILSQWIVQQAFASRYIGTFLSLRTWLSTGVTAIFYIFSGFSLDRYVIPILAMMAFILPIEVAEVTEISALSFIFIALGCLIASALIIYRLIPLAKKYLRASWI